jgi:hypothetical protein
MILTSLVFGAGGTYGEIRPTPKKHFRTLLKKQNDFYKLFYISYNIKMSSWKDKVKAAIKKAADNPSLKAALKTLGDDPKVQAALKKASEHADVKDVQAALKQAADFKIRAKKSARKSKKSPKKSARK